MYLWVYWHDDLFVIFDWEWDLLSIGGLINVFWANELERVNVLSLNNDINDELISWVLLWKLSILIWKRAKQICYLHSGNLQFLI